jgi:hypothetical protein
MEQDVSSPGRSLPLPHSAADTSSPADHSSYRYSVSVSDPYWQPQLPAAASQPLTRETYAFSFCLQERFRIFSRCCLSLLFSCVPCNQSDPKYSKRLDPVLTAEDILSLLFIHHTINHTKAAIKSNTFSDLMTTDLQLI